MSPIRTMIGAALLLGQTVPASAQIFWKSPDFSGPPVLTLEPGFGPTLPGASPAEERAALVWNLRSALNIAALQCAFEPTARTLENYNAILGDHSKELNAAYAVLAAYYKRTTKTPKAAQAALDVFGTRTISAYSTVRGQLGFCETAGKIGRTALFAPKGNFGTVATERLRTLKNSLKTAGDQQFTMSYIPPNIGRLPNLNPACWDKKGRYKMACSPAS
jgi:hypothetical protein